MKSRHHRRLRPCIVALFLAVTLAVEVIGGGPVQAGQRLAIRTLTCIDEFDDASDVLANNYRDDIDNAFKSGLIVGKVSDDGQFRYYDPNALITVGEMANIVARNYGAPVEVVGTDAVAYLNTKGISLSGPVDALITVTQLKDLGAQTADRAGKVDLAVLRDAAGGVLSPDAGAGITRGHAVEVYQPPVTAATAGSTAAVTPSLPPQVAGPAPGPGPTPTPPPAPPPPPPPPPPPVAFTPTISVAATVSPDPAKAGATVVISATTNLTARRVTARSPWGQAFELSPAPGGLSWRGEVVVPVKATDGPYVFEVTAFGEWNIASCRPVCNVAGSIFDENTCVITD
ncbi:MAG: hypothetical protein ACYC9Q_09835 [Bacillota bacterium]